MAIRKISPAETHTIEEFIRAGQSDDMTYRNFSILERKDGLELIDHNLIYDYMEELTAISEPVQLSQENINLYRYAPDLLSFRLYGTVQLDFVIMAANDMMDPKEFTLQSGTVYLPRRTVLKQFLSEVYNAERKYINKNRSELGIVTI